MYTRNYKKSYFCIKQKTNKRKFTSFVWIIDQLT